MERTAPSSESAEKAALGSVLIKPLAMATLQAELPRGTEEFLFPLHREIYAAMEAIQERRMPIDVVSLEDELRRRGVLGRLPDGIAYLMDLANAVPTAENVGHYARIIRNKARLRSLIAACAQVQSTAYGDVVDVESFMSDAVAEIGSVAISDGQRSETLDETIQKILADLDSRADGNAPLPLVPTGIARLDKKLGGGLGEEWFVVVAAPPSIGKTSWALNVVTWSALHGIPSLVFSLEQSRRELAVKIMALAAKVGTSAFKYTTLDRKKVIAGANAASPLSRFITIEKHRRIGQMEMVATAWRAKNQGPALIVVDYVQKMVGFRARGASKEEEITGNAQALKDLARDLKLPVIGVSAVDNSSSKENRAVKMGDARGSKAIEYEADVFIAVHRDRLVKRGGAELIVLKNRHGEVGKVPVTWIGEYQAFEEPERGPVGAEVPDPDDEAGELWR
jgi:replicative DNA helicase